MTQFDINPIKNQLLCLAQNLDEQNLDRLRDELNNIISQLPPEESMLPAGVWSAFLKYIGTRRRWMELSSDNIQRVLQCDVDVLRLVLNKALSEHYIVTFKKGVYKKRSDKERESILAMHQQ